MRALGSHSVARAASLAALVATTACGSGEEQGTVTLEVSGLLDGDTISLTLSSKSSILDDDVNTVAFDDVGNGVHVLDAWPDRYEFTCPGAGAPTVEAYVPEDRQKESVSVLEGADAEIRCAYVTSRAVADISFADTALGDCVLANGQAYVHRIETLDCVSGSITSLSGLEELVYTTNVNFDGNSITDVTPLAGLTQLLFVKLMNNDIVAGVPGLSNLDQAAEVWLDNNPGVPCDDLQGLIDALGTSVVRPGAVEPGVNCAN